MSQSVNITIYRQREEEGRDLAPTVTHCALCPDWEHAGTAAGGREAAREHRARFHPGIVPRARRKLRSLNSFAQRQIDASEWDEINEERRKRALLTGVELSD